MFKRLRLTSRMSLLRCHLHSFNLAAFMPAAWDNHQDVWAVKPKTTQ
jgi:hypothetical protein